MAEESIQTISEQVGQFQTLSQLLYSSTQLQIALIILIVGIIVIITIYRKFAKWTRSQKFHYSRPHFANFVRVAVLPFFAIALISSTNFYIQAFELFKEPLEIIEAEITEELTPRETFAKILNTINILVIGYTIGHMLPIVINKREKSILERGDFEAWKQRRGFKDDGGNLFHKLYKWIPPKNPPTEIPEDEFKRHLQTKEGRTYLEQFRTSKGASIGSYEKLIDNPFEEWKKFERTKYEKYYEACISGNNESGRKLRPGQDPEEIFTIEIWREERRFSDYDVVLPGARPPGYAEVKRKDLPKSLSQLFSIGIFVGFIIGVASWWGVDLIVLATATGGLAIGVGLALQETMQNWFAYIMIRKDKIFLEGEIIKLDTGYMGYVQKITPRVTYIRDPLHESFAIIPTRQLVSAQIINYTKELKIVPALVDVGVSYLNDPKQVASILVKVGKRTMREAIDDKGAHLVAQKNALT